MKSRVKIKIEDENGKILKTHFIRVNTYDLPAGNIEEGERPIQAAARELLERTGYQILEDNLKEAGVDDGFMIFEGRKRDLLQISNPGEKGGYSTDIIWE